MSHTHTHALHDAALECMRVQVRVLPAALGVRVRVPCVPYGARAPGHHLPGAPAWRGRAGCPQQPPARA